MGDGRGNMNREIMKGIMGEGRVMRRQIYGRSDGRGER